MNLGNSGASPYHGLIPLEDCRLFTMNPKALASGAPRGFTRGYRPTRRGDLFLHIIERGCSDLVLIGTTGPLTGRVLIGNADGFWGPNVSSAPDLLAWYERWLDHVARRPRQQSIGTHLALVPGPHDTTAHLPSGHPAGVS